MLAVRIDERKKERERETKPKGGKESEERVGKR
jgi:hypothetical protein